jgi:alcohol dehydrogenase
VGDHVLGVTRFGAFATHVALDTAYLRPIPADWSYEQAAAFPVQTLTAAYGLFSCGGLQPGDAVLVQSAAGGVGLQALQICCRLGCAVLGLVGSPDKVQLLEQQFKHSSGSGGLHFAVRQQDTAAIQQQLAGFLAEQRLEGFQVVLDAVAGPYFRPSYEALRPTGRYVIFGAAALTPPPGASLQPGLGLLNPSNLLAAAKLVWGWINRPKLDVLAMPGDNKSVAGFNLIWLYNQQRLMAGLYATVERLQLPAPLVGHTYSWQQLPEALAFLQSGRSVGKVVVVVPAAVTAAVPDA